VGFSGSRGCMRARAFLRLLLLADAVANNAGRKRRRPHRPEYRTAHRAKRTALAPSRSCRRR
jgi:hypothetical protein